jgi:predicted O-linked N-acetylglucosamine transferase (SPINDLY family)
LRLYDGIDIGLDTLPYNGITTTCDALWMGVPVISVVGPGGGGVSRAGFSILNNVGLPELATTSPDEFVATATRLAGDRPRLAELRATLRQRMQGSPLMRAADFAHRVESAYRTIWRRWGG